MTNTFVRFLKEWTLPVAITVGAGSYLLFAEVPVLEPAADVLGPFFDTIFPLSVFATLFLTFCKVDFHQMRPHRWHLGVLVVQLLLIILNVAIILRFSPLSEGTGETSFFHPFTFSFFHPFTFSFFHLLFEAILTCIIAPSATAAPVIVGKLGGNISTMSAFTVISSFTQALIIPVVFPLLEPSADISFTAAFLVILRKLALVLLLPLVLGWVVQRAWQSLHRWIISKPNLSFYCWSFSLAITAGITLKNIMHSHAPWTLLLTIALATLFVCFIQYALGRGIGHWLGEPLNSGQALFQKNTALSIWVSYIYLNPIASVGAGCYVLWQNIINSLELWRHQNK